MIALEMDTNRGRKGNMNTSLLMIGPFAVLTRVLLFGSGILVFQLQIVRSYWGKKTLGSRSCIPIPHKVYHGKIVHAFPGCFIQLTIYCTVFISDLPCYLLLCLIHFSIVMGKQIFQLLLFGKAVLMFHKRHSLYGEQSLQKISITNALYKCWLHFIQKHNCRCLLLFCPTPCQ